MPKIEVKQKTQIYEFNGNDIPIGKELYLGIESHWSNDEEVVLVIKGRRYTVDGNDLKTAIDNAMNSGG